MASDSALTVDCNVVILPEKLKRPPIRRWGMFSNITRLILFLGTLTKESSKATVWNALAKCNLKPDQSVAIIGIGGLGILAVQFAKALRFRTVAVDNYLQSLNLASDVGPGLEPDLLIDYSDKEATKILSGITYGVGLNAVVVCNDDVGLAEWSLKLLQHRGVCVPLGLPEKGYHFKCLRSYIQRACYQSFTLCRYGIRRKHDGACSRTQRQKSHHNSCLGGS